MSVTSFFFVYFRIVKRYGAYEFHMKCIFSTSNKFIPHVFICRLPWRCVIVLRQIQQNKSLSQQYMVETVKGSPMGENLTRMKTK